MHINFSPSFSGQTGKNFNEKEARRKWEKNLAEEMLSV